MMNEHKNQSRKTALIICNSFDSNRFDIEDNLQDNQYFTEVFEIDRMRKQEQ